ncbi:MAG: GNAT family N-acetyltransferase [Candidatus Heimdallarchaeota archaeon]|nr:GNAT family N-acetyltransferase [Candidatus Heimdallarchaeota archaeon]
MSDYEIEKYKEEYIDDQVKIGKEVSKEWNYYGQTDVEGLKQAYSQDTFDPDTRLYCFKEGKMVSFVTSQILPMGEDGIKSASIRFPLSLPGHEEVFDLLMNEIFKVLTEKEVQTIVANITDSWGDFPKKAIEYGFEKISDAGKILEIKVEDLEIIEGYEQVKPYDKEKDLEELTEIFVRELNMTEEQAKQNFELIDTHESVIAHLVLRDEGKIVARTYMANTQEEERKQLGYIYSTDSNYQNILLSKIAEICKEKGVKKLQVALFGNLLPTLEIYLNLGFELKATTERFEKKL